MAEDAEYDICKLIKCMLNTLFSGCKQHQFVQKSKQLILKLLTVAPLLTQLWLSILGFLIRGPRPPLGATERFSESHKQIPSLGSFAVILLNSSVIW